MVFGTLGQGVAKLLSRAAVALLLALCASSASAQIQRPEWVQDVNWHASVGTGMAAETGGVINRDPLLLYFGGNVRKSWRWWYGLTFKSRADLYTGITDYPMVPYKFYSEGMLGMGAPMFQMAVARAELVSEFAGLCKNFCTGYSTGTNIRLQASTLPTVTGEIALQDGKHLFSYFGAPLQFVIGRYSATVQQQAEDYSWMPYTSGQLKFEDRITLTEWAQLTGAMTLFKAYSNPEFRFIVDVSIAVGIMENAVQFSLDITHDHWKTPAGFTENVATFTLAARLKI